MVFVVMTRRHGLLLAAPEFVLADEVLARRMQAGAQDLVGPSTRIDVDAGVLDEDALLQAPIAVPDKLVACALLDASADMVQFLTPLVSKEEIEACRAPCSSSTRWSGACSFPVGGG